uniref:Putative secreted protein n=1 Tax=Ixodes ricinus TaxID=34613 RepID=A0A6B0UH25_IXORI
MALAVGAPVQLRRLVRVLLAPAGAWTCGAGQPSTRPWADSSWWTSEKTRSALPSSCAPSPWPSRRLAAPWQTPTRPSSTRMKPRKCLLDWHGIFEAWCLPSIPRLVT